MIQKFKKKLTGSGFSNVCVHTWGRPNRNITEKISQFWILHLLCTFLDVHGNFVFFQNFMSYYAIVDGGKNIKISRVAKVLGWGGSEESVHMWDTQPLHNISTWSSSPELQWNCHGGNEKKEEVSNSNLRELYSILAKSEKWPLEKWLIRPEKVTGTKAPLAPWHVWRPIWVHFSPWGPIFPVKNLFS